MSIRGIFASHSGLNGERGVDLAARVLMTAPGGTAPLLALSSGMPTARAPQTNFSWIEDEHLSGNQTVVTGGNAAAASIVVDDAGIWQAGSILMNEVTGEYLYVTSIAADGVTVNILRGFTGTTAATISTGDTIQSVGSAFAEGSDKPESVSQKGEERLNYVQIFKNGWSVTGTAAATDYLTGSQVAYNREMAFSYHAEDIERAFIWGRKSIRNMNGKQLRTTNGVLAQIEQYGGLVVSANSNGVSGALNLKDLLNFLRRVFDIQAKGLPNERIAFCGSQLLELIQQMVIQDTTYQISQTETAYGITVTTISAIGGKLKLMSHPLMVENAIWQRELYVLHPGLIRKREKRPTWSEEFGPQKQNNAGKDATEGYIGDELGFELRGARTMGIYRNIRTAVASYP
jgi:hypothetical protein